MPSPAADNGDSLPRRCATSAVAPRTEEVRHAVNLLGQGELGTLKVIPGRRR
jgi:hypothetical protein